MNFKLTTKPQIKFSPFEGYFVLRLTDFNSDVKLDKYIFIHNLVKYIHKNWDLIEIFHKREGRFNFDTSKKRENINVIKWKIFKRDNFTCQLCGSQELLELDHIIPISKGGEDKEDNYQTLCQSCNRKKKDKI